MCRYDDGCEQERRPRRVTRLQLGRKPDGDPRPPVTSVYFCRGPPDRGQPCDAAVTAAIPSFNSDVRPLTGGADSNGRREKLQGKKKKMSEKKKVSFLSPGWR